MGRRRAKLRSKRAAQYTPEEIRAAWAELVGECAKVVEMGPDAIEPAITAIQTHAKGEDIPRPDFLALMETGLPINISICRLAELLNHVGEMHTWVNKTLSR